MASYSTATFSRVYMIKFRQSGLLSWCDTLNICSVRSHCKVRRYELNDYVMRKECVVHRPLVCYVTNFLFGESEILCASWHSDALICVCC
jgi:hypothetical protein